MKKIHEDHEIVSKYAEFGLLLETIGKNCSRSLIRGFSLIRSSKMRKFTDKVSPFDSVGRD